MSLETAIAELESGQSHNDMLLALRARTISKDGIAQSGIVLAYLASIGKLGAIKAIAADETSPLRDAAEATLITLQTREGFDFSIPETLSMLQAYVAISLLTEAQAESVRAIGATTVPEFEGLTAKQVIAVRNPELIANTPIESAISNTVECGRHVGIAAGVVVNSVVPAPTALELHIATSVDNITFTPFRYAGSVGVADSGAYTINVNPQLTQRYNKIKFTSKEFALDFTLGAVGAY